MRPYSIVEGKRAYWSAEASNFKLQSIKREVVAELCKRDVERACAAGLDVSGERLSVLEWVGDDAISDSSPTPKQGSYQVNAIAQQIHHSGQETMIEVRKRWAAFCRQPRNESEAEQLMHIAQDAAIDAELGVFAVDFGGPVANVSESQPKRRGRPRKDAFAQL